MPRLIIEICPHEPRASAYVPDGADAADIARDMAGCRASGDCQPACEYVRDVLKPEFRIVARDAAGAYENRLATAEEKAATARAIYFDSESDFDDEDTAETYLIWQAADDLEGGD